MIVIFTQHETLIMKDAKDAKRALLSVYGENIGLEAYDVVKKGRIGTSYRKSGGPLVKVVTREQAVEIREKEIAIDMME